MNNQEQALNAFIRNISEARREVAKINSFLDDHMNKGAENITWASAGDAARIRDMLKEITETFNL